MILVVDAAGHVGRELVGRMAHVRPHCHGGSRDRADAIVTGPQTATPVGAMKFAERLAGPHDLISLSGTQFAFYDDPDTVMRASASAVEHLQRTLAYRASASDADAAALMMTQSVRARTHVLGTMSPQQQP